MKLTTDRDKNIDLVAKCQFFWKVADSHSLREIIYMRLPKLLATSKRSRPFKPAASNPNGLLSQKLCHYVDQGRTFNDIIIRAAHWTAYFDLSELNLAESNTLKAFES